MIIPLGRILILISRRTLKSLLSADYISIFFKKIQFLDNITLLYSQDSSVKVTRLHSLMGKHETFKAPIGMLIMRYNFIKQAWC